MDNYLQKGLIRNIQNWAPKEPEKRNIFFHVMSLNKHLNTETLVEYVNENWCVHRLMRNKRFSFDWVDVLPNLAWDWDQLSHLNPPLQFVLAHLSRPWDWQGVSLSANITFSDMVRRKDLPWMIEEVLFNEISHDEDIEYLRTFSDRYDFQAWVDHSRRVKWDLVKKSTDLPWVYFSIEPNIETSEDLDFIRNNDPAVWNWGYLSMNTPIHLIVQNQDLPWNWLIVSTNPTVTYKDVVDNPSIQWDYSMVPAEKFNDGLARQWIAASHIKRMFKRSISDPSYKMCRDRLSNEFMGLETVGSVIEKGNHVA